MSEMTPREVLKKYWGYDSFRPLQEQIIQSIVDGKDTLAILPTGGGKSICFQVPALLSKGTCLVVSPLIALMQDQVERLNKMHIAAKAITTGLSLSEIDEIMDACEENELKFLYISPERLGNKRFLDNVPIIALTASATPKVKIDIADKLQLHQPSIFFGSFKRENLAYKNIQTEDKINTLIQLIKHASGSSIVYCKTRRRAKEFSDLLNQFQLKADFYHAGLTQEQRSEKQQDWIAGITPCIVCTNAFGMGIDKPDVRLVVHMDVPDCLENYYQEAGRAGRDEQYAEAVLLFRKQELEELRLLPETKFPSIATIRKVYKALGNYCQLPSGSGKGMNFDFDMQLFLNSFKVSLNEVLYSLETLKQEGIIHYQDQVFSPSTVVFLSDRTSLESFEKEYPALEPLIKLLLRTYGGIFDVAIKINEKQLAWLLKTDITYVKTDLMKLHQKGIIEYLAAKETTQIVFLEDRIVSEELHINYPLYQERKKEYTNRIEKMIYYTESLECRSIVLSNYFGDTNNVACGKCDFCLSTNKSATDKKVIFELTKKIKKELQSHERTIAELELILGIEKSVIKESLI
ncbi:MAG: RecQ family ATP-dependent DNA helicase, partial [Chitinophagia bacterium]|nr:RecQ family ATP-dependent DNA helicase [Chitinophagia bacterium]